MKNINSILNHLIFCHTNNKKLMNKLLSIEKIELFEYLIKNNNQNLLIDLLKNLKLKKIEKNNIIFKNNVYFFIVLKGSVNVYIKGDNSINSEIYTNLFFKKFKNNKNIFKENKFKLVKISEITKGNNFGDITYLSNEILISNDKYKNITLAYISISEYNKILKSIQNNIIITKKKIFENSWKIKNFKNKYYYINFFEIKNYKKFNTLSIKGSILNNVYIILKGNVTLKNTLKLKINKENSFTTKNITSVARTLNEGNIIGYNEFICNHNYFYFTSKIESDKAKIMIININIFKKIINKNIFISEKLQEKYQNFSDYFKNCNSQMNFFKKNIYNKKNNLKIFNKFFNKISLPRSKFMDSKINIKKINSFLIRKKNYLDSKDSCNSPTPLHLKSLNNKNNNLSKNNSNIIKNKSKLNIYKKLVKNLEKYRNNKKCLINYKWN